MNEIMATIDFVDGKELLTEFPSWEALWKFKDAHNAEIEGITARQKGTAHEKCAEKTQILRI